MYRTIVGLPDVRKIEFLTSELARSIAGIDYSFYTFQGIKSANNRELHITSPNFDEPRCLALIKSCRQVVTVHGLEGDTMKIQVGGRDVELRARVGAALSKAGFQTKVETTGRYGGTDPLNICNRGKSSAGVQIEIKAGLRKILRDDPEHYTSFVDAARTAIAG
jgi:phage replication-related protein YjqB (UPF0714/DUF867 family)